MATAGALEYQELMSEGKNLQLAALHEFERLAEQKKTARE
jgi:hypothetical protein